MLATLARAKQLILTTLVGIGAIGGVVTASNSPTEEPLALEAPSPIPTATVAPTATPAPIVVFVSGAVVEPGVYTLPPESRVVDALEAAGGPTADAATESLNQATPLSDGMQIHMPEKGAAPLPAALSPGSDSANPSSSDGAANGTLVRLNNAGSAELESLPGIGPALATRIIEYRDSHGPFSSIEQLTEVKGIGDKLLEKISDHLILD